MALYVLRVEDGTSFNCIRRPGYFSILSSNLCPSTDGWSEPLQFFSARWVAQKESHIKIKPMAVPYHLAPGCRIPTENIDEMACACTLSLFWNIPAWQEDLCFSHLRTFEHHKLWKILNFPNLHFLYIPCGALWNNSMTRTISQVAAQAGRQASGEVIYALFLYV